MTPEPRRAVFLDRDGTMIEEAGYLSSLDAVKWYPGTKDAIRLLNRADFVVCVITNQGGIGLGLAHGLQRTLDELAQRVERDAQRWGRCR